MSLTLSDLSLEVSSKFTLGPLQGEFMPGTTAIAGHNGSGKSTLFSLLTASQDADQGDIYWKKERVMLENADYKQKLGFLPQPLDIPLWSNADNLLRYLALLQGMTPAQSEEKIALMTQMWQMQSYLKKPLISCSYGMRKRVALSCALLQEPELLILDEPLSGLDISHITTLRRLLQRRSEKKQYTIFSTHILSFAAEEADHMILMSEGQWMQPANWQNFSVSQRRKTLEDFLVRSIASVRKSP